MEQFYGYFLYAISLATMGGIYAILTLGLNIQWGFTGLFNVGIAGFFAIGAYVSGILTTAPSARHLGGYEMPYVVSFIAAMLVSGGIAWGVGKVCLRLRTDYLAIATIGIAEIFRLILKNETWATNGPRGVSMIPKPFEDLAEPWNQLAFLAMVLVTVFVIYLALEVAHKSPWGRVMTAFVIGCMLMALAGAYTSHYLKFIDPHATEPLATTFLVWVMLIVGGSANNRGAILGAFIMWTLWSASEILSSRLPGDLAIRTAYIRIFIIGFVLQIFLQKFPKGFLKEVRPHPRAVKAPGASKPA